MADEEENNGEGASKSAVNVSLVNVNVQADAAGLGKVAQHVTPLAIEVVRALGAAMGRVYRPVAIIAEGAAQRHVRIQNLRAEAKLLAELGDKLPRDRLVVEGEILPPVAELPKPRKPHARRTKPKGNTIGFATHLETPPTIDLRPDTALRSRARRLNEANEVRWQENIESTFAKAFDLAQESTVKPAHSIDSDFVAEWVEAVKNISNEQLQEVWARILIEAPTEEDGRVPKPVIDFMRQLDPKMARILKQIYLEGAITGWRMPVNRTEMDYISEEVGLATVSQSTFLSILDGIVTISAVAQDDSFELVQLSERARRIGHIVYGPVDTVAQAQAFFEGFPQWFSDLMAKSFIRTIKLNVTDRKSVWQFTVSTLDGQLISVIPEFAPAHTKYVDDIDFGGAPYEAALKAAFRKIASMKKLKFDHAYTHAQYGIKDWPPQKRGL